MWRSRSGHGLETLDHEWNVGANELAANQRKLVPVSISESESDLNVL